MKRRISGLVAIACMTLTAASAAMAHDTVRRIVVVHEGPAVVTHRGVAPYWLRAHRPFQRWYFESPYRRVSRLSWIELYDLYRLDLRPSRPLRRGHHHGYRHSSRHAFHYVRAGRR